MTLDNVRVDNFKISIPTLMLLEIDHFIYLRIFILFNSQSDVTIISLRSVLTLKCLLDNVSLVGKIFQRVSIKQRYLL